MPRKLFLHDASPDYQTRAALNQLDRNAEQRSIGHGGTYSNPILAVLHIRRSADAFDLTHAWGEAALNVAALAVGGKIIYSPTRFPSRKSVRWLRAVMAYRNVHVVCPTATMRRVFVENGIAVDRCHLVRPGVDFSRVKRRRDPALRESLGFAPDDVVILAAGESIRAADHALSAWAVAILHVLDPKFRLLLWGHGDVAGSARKFASKLGQGDFYRVAPRDLSYESLLPAIDVGLVTAVDPVATLPIAVLMAAGLPIVSTVTPTVAELLEDRHNALFVPSRAPRQIARRVMDLLENDNLQWAISDMARTEAFEYFAQSRFIEQMNDLYEQVAQNQAVKITTPPPGAGARFHGLANA